MWPTVKKWALRLAVAGLVLTIAAGIGGYLLIRHYEEGLPSIAELSQGYRPAQVTRVVARDGTTLAEIFNERRTLIKIEDLPRHVKLAVLAAEDASFYEHEGINWLGIGRAAIVNLRAGRTRQGGSTITQQVVKNILLETQERTYSRKMKEALLARRLEQEALPRVRQRSGRQGSPQGRRSSSFISITSTSVTAATGSKRRRATTSESPRRTSRSPSRRCSPAFRPVRSCSRRAAISPAP